MSGNNTDTRVGLGVISCIIIEYCIVLYCIVAAPTTDSVIDFCCGPLGLHFLRKGSWAVRDFTGDRGMIAQKWDQLDHAGIEHMCDATYHNSVLGAGPGPKRTLVSTERQIMPK